MTSSSIISRYPQLFGDISNPRETGMYFGIECGPGWLPIIDECLSEIALLEEDVRIMQIKEKFGGLCIYTNGHSPTVSAIIRAAEDKCAKTCERCGEPGTLQTNGWYEVICPTCQTNKGN